MISVFDRDGEYRGGAYAAENKIVKNVQFRWLKFKAIYAAFHISTMLFANQLE